jgi:hypothetical protein
MAYSPPAGNAVNFNFTGDAYVAPSGDAVNFNFTEARVLRVLLTQRWLTQEVPSQLTQVTKRWQTFGLESDRVQSLQRWEEFALGDITMYLGSLWNTNSPGMDKIQSDQRWSVGITDFDLLRLNQRWATVDVPFDVFQSTQRWAVQKVLSDTIQKTGVYITVGVRSAVISFTQRWTTFFAPSDLVQHGQRWVSHAVLKEDAALEDTYAIQAIETGVLLTGQVWVSGVFDVELIQINQSWKMRYFVDNAVEVRYRDVISGDAVLDSTLGRTEVAEELVIQSDLSESVANSVAIRSELVEKDTVSSEILVNSSLIDVSSTVEVNPPTITIGTQKVLLSDMDISFDEGQYGWVCNATLFSLKDYLLFEPDIAFTVHLEGEDYTFILDSRQLSRSEVVSMEAKVSGISPSALLDAPRAVQITKTWDIDVAASSVVSEVLGGYPYSWEILDWVIPGGRLSVSDQTPLAIVQLIAQAAGALVMTEPDGSLVVQYAFPISVAEFDDTTADHEFSDFENVFSVREEFTPAEVINKLRLMDEVLVDKVSADFQPDKENTTKGQLRVFPKPFRLTPTVEHTSNVKVSVTKRTQDVEELVETVQVVGGRGNLSKPIYQIVTIEWLYVNLTGITFTADETEFRTTHPSLKESLVKITYRTRYVRFDASGEAGSAVQFLVKDTESV